MSSSDESSHAYAVPSGTTSMKIELYKAGSTTALVATKEFSIPYDGTVKPQYLGIGVLSATGTMAFTGATVDDSGVITPGSTVSAIITGDWMVGYVTSTLIATVYYWNGSAWTSTTDQKYVSVAAFDIMNLTTGGYTVANYTIIMNAIIYNLMVSNLKLLTGGKLFAGNGNFCNADTPIFLGYDTDGTAKFSLGTGLQYDGTDLTIEGTINATAGRFAAGIGQFTSAGSVETYDFFRAGSGIVNFIRRINTGSSSYSIIVASVLYSQYGGIIGGTYHGYTKQALVLSGYDYITIYEQVESLYNREIIRFTDNGSDTLYINDVQFD